MSKHATDSHTGEHGAAEDSPMKPLEGIRVLDLTRYVSGPHASQMLADFGADVAKVEDPTRGDPARHLDRLAGGPDSLFAITLSRGKRSVGLDLYQDEGRAVLADLVRSADVMLENYRPGTLERMGFGWERLQELNPRLILARISGFGQDGPWAQRASYDPVIQAVSGLMELTGPADGPPTVCGTIMTDYLTGVHAVVGVLAALQGRERTGRGQWVDVAMLDGATSILMTVLPEYLMHGRKRTRRGNKNPISVPSHCFRCRDGRYLHVTAAADGEFARLCEAMQRTDLLDDPRFSDMETRKQNDVALETIVGDWLADLDSDDAERRLLAVKLPTGRVADIADVAENEQLRHRGHIVDAEHPIQGRIPVAGPPVRFSDTPPDRHYRIPLVGEHTGDVLREWLGYSDQRLGELATAGVIAPADDSHADAQ